MKVNKDKQVLNDIIGLIFNAMIEFIIFGIGFIMGFIIGIFLK